MKPLLYREVKRKLEAAGFVEVSQRGSHVKFARSTPEGTLTAIVPRHREIAVGTLNSIVSQSGLTRQQFEGL